MSKSALRWLYGSGRYMALLPIGVLVGLLVSYLLWNQVLSFDTPYQWSKTITGVELGGQVGALAVLAGVNAPAGWLDSASVRPMRAWALVFGALAVGLASVVPFLTWAALKVTPASILVRWQRGLNPETDLPLYFFAALLAQVWWTMGWGLAGLGLVGRLAALPAAALGFFVLLFAQMMKLLQGFPGGYMRSDAHLNPESLGWSLTILAVGLALAGYSKLGAAPVVGVVRHLP